MILATAVLSLIVVLGGVALVVLGLRARRVAEQTLQTEPQAEAGAAPDLTPELAEVLSQRIETLLGDHERRLTEAFASVREDLTGLKSDVEWLAGERMIEQAIALAQTGSDPDEIGQELGLSRDAAATISMFRKH
jgi:hypothetical protein